MIKAVLAVDSNNGIGREGRLPWNISSEMGYFKNYTNGCLCVMGRKTYEDIKASKRKSYGDFLEGRDCLVISTEIRSLQRSNTYSRIMFCDNLEGFITVLKMSKKSDDKSLTDVCIIGGKTIYERFLSDPELVDEISISFIHDDFECDTFFEVEDYIQGFVQTGGFEPIDKRWEAKLYHRHGELYEN